MRNLDWLIARPVAHRGLHDVRSGIIENTPSAVAAAIEAGYAIEVDLQITADGEAMVHHDDALGRLTEGSERLADLRAEALRRVPFKGTADRMLTLGELLDLVDGRATLVLELKSHFDGDRRLVARTAAVLASSSAPVAVMSFDPFQIEALRAIEPRVPRGIVAERRYSHPEWQALPRGTRWTMAHLLHGLRTCPHFVAYAVQDLPALAPLFAKHIFGLPLLTWTVRTAEQARTARRLADQMIFEGFRP
ncbi:MAG: glycerophosphodiester phosphodiesterase family protein [Xanthobacteraceae bacterium]